MLRTHESFFSTPKYQYQLPPLAKEKLKQTSLFQKNLVQRLSRPKTKKDY
ncbi:unnamed protein product [Paramecium sonneborni]|uniref:Uncharacterized protein n=1 Tax=Paramecium sonneborni TaxID=65129 RepID=A0A8S1REZ0_9CILI|nr:unnamed protein product [Paramecium sonneborni]